MAQQNQAQGAVAPAQKSGQVANFIEYKNRLTSSVLNKIGELRKGGITVPVGYSADNQIYLAFLKLTSMTAKNGQPMLSQVTPQSVANSLLTMCIKGLSMEKGQCTFIQYGNEVQLQQEYHGTIALAKRYGAGDPQAQVIYEGDEFEYEINPKTGKKVVTKHVQKLENIDNDKIVGAWCLVPYADHPDWEPKVEIMTMKEIRQSWLQGPTKGQSPAHRNFPQEMAKKTVIGRACKLFISTSDDAGVYESNQAPEWQENKVEGDEGKANATDAVFNEIPTQAPTPEEVQAAAGAPAEVVNEQTGEVKETTAPEAAAPAPEKKAEKKAAQAPAAAGMAGGDPVVEPGFFNM